ncbi:iron export ABC transporter permease subunit FetB [Veillonella sp. oral taxon 158]|uniref:ABC transporter permease n=1 Tax=Veillonella sp. oral taxon 158 TaxID=671228 RepID=UPI0001EB46D9|nr:iron export ABC transporter permease subunit FetB [Veillonella sp. oral taxon 158]EFR60874.1 TIGR00245 family protein [Veillonella sp. oral taxon 158 str. F0412]
MSQFQTISATSLCLASVLVIISILISYRQELKLEKDIFISAVRATIQLFVIGFILSYIFGTESPIFIIGLLGFMAINAAYNSSKRGKGIPYALWISWFAITVGASITLTILLLTGVLNFTAYQVIPVGGMVISGAMVAIGLCYRQMLSNFELRKQEVEIKLALGSTPKQASKAIVRDVIKTGLQPTVDSAKTLGIVALPGMMTGLILAGMPPLEAVKYQIIVTFMSLSTISIACFITCQLAYKTFFNNRNQLNK